MATDQAVAKEIAAQIGRRAFVMMGTKVGSSYELLGDKNSLTFRIRGCKKYKKIQVVLNSEDTYDVSFIHIGRAPEFRVKIETVRGVYVENLHDVISSHTGLLLSL